MFNFVDSFSKNEQPDCLLNQVEMNVGISSDENAEMRLALLDVSDNTKYTPAAPALHQITAFHSPHAKQIACRQLTGQNQWKL